MNEKVVRDGKVAVIVSPGFGAGWSTWNCGQGMFDPAVVAWIEAGKPDPTPYEQTDECDQPYNGGLDHAEIVWLPQGEQFYIDEYEGAETLVLRSDGELWVTA